MVLTAPDPVGAGLMQSPTWTWSIGTCRDRLGGAGRVVEGGADDDGRRVADGDADALADRVDGAESPRPAPLTVVVQPASIATPTSVATIFPIAHPRTAPPRCTPARYLVAVSPVLSAVVDWLPPSRCA